MTQLQTVWRHRFAGPALRVVFAYILLIEVADQWLFGLIDIPNAHISWLEVGRYPDAIPPGVLVGGAVIGALYGLVAMGLTRVYKANATTNFRQASLGPE